MYDNDSDTATLKLEWVPTADETLEPYGGRSALDLKVVGDRYLGPDSNTRALYHFNEGDDLVTADDYGVDNYGVIYNAVWHEEELGEVYREGVISGPTLWFDGVGDSVGVFDENELDIAGAITIEAWVRFGGCDPAATATNLPTIVRKEVGGDTILNYGFYLACPAGGGNPQLHYSYDNSVSAGLCESNSPAAIALADGEWHYVAVAAVPGAQACYYFDDQLIGGSCVSLATCDAAAQTGTAEIRIGDNGYNGLMDEVRISAVDRSSAGTVSPVAGLGFAPYNSYVYREFDSSKSYTFAGGTQECLEFDVYLDASNPSYSGGFDGILTSGPLNLRSSGLTDQNGVSIHPGSALDGSLHPSADAVGKWYHRCFDIDGYNGDTLNTPKIAHESDPRGAYSIKLDNIVITNDSDGHCAACTPATITPPLYTFYEIGAPPESNTTAEVDTDSVVFASLDSYSQTVEPVPTDFLYASGLRRLYYESAFESKAGGEADYWDQMVCVSIDAVVDHEWSESGTRQEPEIIGNDVITGDDTSIIPACQGKAREDNWAMRWQGAVYIPSDGNHGFRITVNNFARLMVDNVTWINSCGSLSSESLSDCNAYAAAVLGGNITKGWHYIDIDFLEGPGVSPNFDAEIHFYWDIGSGWQIVPMNRLAMRQLVPAAYKNRGGSGETDEVIHFGTFVTDLMDQALNMMYDMMGAMGMGCSTAAPVGYTSAAEAKFARSMGNLRDYLLARTGIRETLAGISRLVARPFSKAVDSHPVLKQSSKVLAGPVAHTARALEDRCIADLRSASPPARMPVITKPGCSGP